MTEPKKGHNDLDDLQRRLAALKDTSANTTKPMRPQDFSPFAPIVNLGRGAVNVVKDFYRNSIEPYSWLKYPTLFICAVPILAYQAAKYTGKTAGWIWKNGAYKKDKETGTKVFSKKRATALAMAAAITGVGMTPTAYGEFIRYFTIEPATDAVAMLSLGRKDETLYLNYSQEINPDKNIHMVRGCKTIQCGEKDSVYFRVEPRLSHNIWSAFNNSKPFFITDHVVAPIAPGVNECKVTSYGIRWRVARWAQAYPQLLSAQCTPISAFGAAAQRPMTTDSPPPPVVVTRPAAPTPAMPTAFN